jgi:hypothetical protein
VVTAFLPATTGLVGSVVAMEGLEEGTLMDETLIVIFIALAGIIGVFWFQMWWHYYGTKRGHSIFGR